MERALEEGAVTMTVDVERLIEDYVFTIDGLNAGRAPILKEGSAPITFRIRALADERDKYRALQAKYYDELVRLRADMGRVIDMKLAGTSTTYVAMNTEGRMSEKKAVDVERLERCEVETLVSIIAEFERRRRWHREIMRRVVDGDKDAPRQCEYYLKDTQANPNTGWSFGTGYDGIRALAAERDEWKGRAETYNEQSASTIRTLAAEVERLRGQMSDLLQQQAWSVTTAEALRTAQENERLRADDKVHWKTRRTLLAEIMWLRELIQAARNELGVPQPGYPQPVANAADILARAEEKP